MSVDLGNENRVIIRDHTLSTSPPSVRLPMMRFFKYLFHFCGCSACVYISVQGKARRRYQTL